MKRIIFLHGWTNRRPLGHWHRLAQNELRKKGYQVWYPQFPSPDTPEPAEWQELLIQENQMMDEFGEGEKIAIAHSLGCLNWLVAAMADSITPFDRVLFVSPPDTSLTDKAEGIKGDPLDLAHPAILPAIESKAGEFLMIAGDNDHWLPEGIQKTYGDVWNMKPLVFPGAGHFSHEDGWGNWQGLIDWIDSNQPEDLLRS
jgi:hypothetical protein